MKKIIYTRPDGGVSIITPAPRFLDMFDTDEEGLAVILAKDVPSDATDVNQVDELDIPVGREFRGAWRQSAGVISVDMPKARNIQMARIENAKQEMAQDIILRDMMGEDMASDKAALRNMNADSQIASAQTPGVLKHAWPVGLSKSTR